jgi:hypothetical protein
MSPAQGTEHETSHQIRDIWWSNGTLSGLTSLPGSSHTSVQLSVDGSAKFRSSALSLNAPQAEEGDVKQDEKRESKEEKETRRN